ncbi:phage holin family protein [Nocardia vermiculata]|uniref:Phage holin family protein n=1 Tax=Nocardia vermiculata TaxID=257274 RepID=A0A846Y0B5_9NOCA|nr:phage holin family protein [Nocardia vermiculata]NKY52723.1 phage holin family protein [Nocardia vermiculata]
MSHTIDGRSADTASVAELVGTTAEQLSRLVREEAKLAAAEAQGKAKRLGAGAGLVAVAAVLALLAAGALVAAAIAALAQVLPVWAAALVVVGGLVLIAALVGLLGWMSIRRATPPIPEQAAASLRQDMAVIKNRSRR